MKITVIAITRNDSTRRIAGSLNAALDIEINGKTGKGVFSYEWDKRDVMVDTLYVSPNIAEDAAAYLRGEDPSCMNAFCSITNEKAQGPAERVAEYNAEATAFAGGMEE